MIDEEAKRNKELCERFPFLLPYEAMIENEEDPMRPRTDKVNPAFEYGYTMLDFVPQGWKALFLRLCEDIRAGIENTDDYHTFRFIDIKEKYGMLRMQADGGNKKTDELMEQCEKASQRTCVNCGKAAKRIGMGRISPYCDDCFNKRRLLVIINEKDTCDQ